jgi:hypothetical protein
MKKNVLATGLTARARVRCRQVAAAARIRTLEARNARYLMHLSEIAQLRAAAANLMMASSLRMTCEWAQREKVRARETRCAFACTYVPVCVGLLFEECHSAVLLQ